MYIDKCIRPPTVDGLHLKLWLTWNICHPCKANLKRKVTVWLKKAVSSSVSQVFLPAHVFLVCPLAALGFPRRSQRAVGQVELLLSSLLCFSFRPDDILSAVLFKTAAQAKVSQCPLSRPRTLGSHGYPGPCCCLLHRSLHYTISVEVRWHELVSLCVSLCPIIRPCLSFPFERQQNGKKEICKKRNRTCNLSFERPLESS